MLPQYPNTHLALRKGLDHFVRALATQAAPMLGSIRSYVRHEGGRRSLFRAQEEDATFVEHEMKEFTAGASVQRAHLRTHGFGAVYAWCKETADQFAEAQSRHFYSILHDVTESTGNVVNANGPLTPETLLALYKQITIDFDRDTREPKLPTCVFHPSQIDSFKAAAEQLHENPDLKAEYTNIIDNQRMAWRDREAARRLVD